MNIVAILKWWKWQVSYFALVQSPKFLQHANIDFIIRNMCTLDLRKRIWGILSGPKIFQSLHVAMLPIQKGADSKTLLESKATLHFYSLQPLSWYAGAICITENIIPNFHKICAYNPFSMEARVTIANV